jgi:hypothetical protein
VGRHRDGAGEGGVENEGGGAEVERRTVGSGIVVDDVVGAEQASGRDDGGKRGPGQKAKIGAGGGGCDMGRSGGWLGRRD